MARSKNPVLAKAIGYRLEKAMARAGITSAQVRNRTRPPINEKTIWRYINEKDEERPVVGTEHAIQLAQLTGVTLDWLLTGRDTTRQELEAWIGVRRPPAAFLEWIRTKDLEGISTGASFFEGLLRGWRDKQLTGTELSDASVIAGALQAAIEPSQSDDY